MFGKLVSLIGNFQQAQDPLRGNDVKSIGTDVMNGVEILKCGWPYWHVPKGQFGIVRRGHAPRNETGDVASLHRIWAVDVPREDNYLLLSSSKDFEKPFSPF